MFNSKRVCTYIQTERATVYEPVSIKDRPQTLWIQESVQNFNNPHSPLLHSTVVCFSLTYLLKRVNIWKAFFPLSFYIVSPSDKTLKTPCFTGRNSKASSCVSSRFLRPQLHLFASIFIIAMDCVFVLCGRTG